MIYFLVTICEGNGENLECLTNQTLVIKKAIYGRQSRLACASECAEKNTCTTEGWLANCAEEVETTSLIKNSCKALPCSLSMQIASDLDKTRGIFHTLSINNIRHVLPSNCVSVKKKYVKLEYSCVDKGKKMNLIENLSLLMILKSVQVWLIQLNTHSYFGKKKLLIVSWKWHHFRSSAQRSSVREVLLEISQNSQENTCAGSQWIKSISLLFWIITAVLILIK